MKKVLGRDRAVILALLGLVPYLEPWILKFVQIWRASNLLGQELLTDYLSACVPSLERGAFLKYGSLCITSLVVGHASDAGTGHISDVEGLRWYSNPPNAAYLNMYAEGSHGA